MSAPSRVAEQSAYVHYTTSEDWNSQCIDVAEEYVDILTDIGRLVSSELFPLGEAVSVEIVGFREAEEDEFVHCECCSDEDEQTLSGFYQETVTPGLGRTLDFTFDADTDEVISVDYTDKNGGFSTTFCVERHDVGIALIPAAVDTAVDFVALKEAAHYCFRYICDHYL